MHVFAKLRALQRPRRKIEDFCKGLNLIPSAQVRAGQKGTVLTHQF